MNLSEVWDSIRADVAVFGLCGGVMAFALKPTRKFAPAFVQVVGGLLVAVTGTPFINLWWPIPNESLFAGVAFMLGISGLGIIRGVPKYVVPLFWKCLEGVMSLRNGDPR